MSDYVLTGKVVDSAGKPFNQVIYIQAVDSDQELYEDRNDDLVATAKVASGDGSFTISFDKADYQDGWLEGKPDIYLLVRNKAGQLVHRTQIRRGVKPDDTEALTFNIVLDSLEKPVDPHPDPYDQNGRRVLAAFAGLGDNIEFRTEDIARNLALLSSSVNAWTQYTREDVWQDIDYDGPQVPRYPWQQSHSHKLGWQDGGQNSGGGSQ